MTTLHRSSRRPKFAGFTLVELLVVITIIGMLMALLIPAVGMVRARARQNTCANNLRQIGLAVTNFASSKGRYPGYVQPVQQADKGWAQVQVASMSQAGFRSASPSTDSRQGSRISWAGVILPQMDRQDLWDNLRNVDGNTDPNDPRRNVVPIEVYICPADNDVTSNPENAALSYVANAGGWDWDRSTYLIPPDAGDTGDNGIFHNLTFGKVTTKYGSNIPDGSTTTLMLSENIHKSPAYCWLGVSSEQFGEQHFGMNWVVNVQPDGTTRATKNQARISIEYPGVLDPTTPDSQLLPYYSRPASTHLGNSVNVVFVDGHGKSIPPEIDYTVYQQLMTPEGRKCVDPTGWNNNLGTNEPIYEFRRAAPISPQDFE